MTKPYYRKAAEREYARAYGRGRALLRYSDAPSPAVVEFAASRYFRRVSSVADFACGEGIDAQYLAQRGCNVVGLDIASAAIHKASELARGAERKPSWLVGDIVDCPLRDASFDLALAMTCFGRLLLDAHRESFLRETFRVLKPGGYLLLASGLLLEEVRRTFPEVFDELGRKRGADLEAWLREEASGQYEPPSQRFAMRDGYEMMLANTGYRVVHSHLDVSAHAWSIVLWARKPDAEIPNVPK